MRKNIRFSILFGALFFLILGISSVLYAVKDSYVRNILFFPTGREAELEGESRRIPKTKSLEERIYRYTRELILGPMDLSLNRMLPKDIEILSCMVRDRILYINFSTALLFQENEVPLSFNETIDSYIYGIQFNFPEIEKVLVTVNGQIPHEPRYVED